MASSGEVRAPSGRAPAGTLGLLGGSVLAAGGAAALVLLGEPRPGGALALASGALALASRASAGPHPVALVRFLDPAVDRVWDGLVLGSLAWALLPAAARPAALALVALAASYF
ncbi:MAG: hypothetical protein HY658_09925, partial [Actinobacteria bacterium]|nr:hypothetical protein [Actinomycetota bacterium]